MTLCFHDLRHAWTSDSACGIPFSGPPFLFFWFQKVFRRGVAVASGSVARNNLRPRCGFTGDDMWLALLGEGMLATLLSFSELNRLGRLNRPWSQITSYTQSQRYCA